MGRGGRVSYDRRERGAPPSASTVARPPGTPGKTTGTGRIPGKPKDEDYATVCDGVDDPVNCPLSPEMRGRALSDLGDAVGTAMDNYRDAIQDSRIEILTTSESSWGFLAEILFYSVTGPLISIGTRALMKYAGKLAADALARGHDRLGVRLAHLSVDKDNVQAALTNASRGLRKTLMGLAHESGDRGKATFLQAMRAQIPSIRLEIKEHARGLNDIELQALIAAYEDVEAHSVENYAAAIDDILRRYDRNHIDDVGRERRQRAHNFPSGDEKPDRTMELIQSGRLAWVNHGRRRELALLSYVNDERSFRHFIDQDFQGLAVNLYAERTGRQPDLINLDENTHAAGCPWADSARTAFTFCVDTSKPTTPTTSERETP